MGDVRPRAGACEDCLTGEIQMPFFMTQASFTEDSLKAMVQKPSNRPDAMAKVVEAHGGKMLQFFWLFGVHDVVTIYEAPSNQAAAAIFMALVSAGAIRSHETTVLVTNQEAMAAMEAAGSTKSSYTTPREEWDGWQDEGGEG